MPSKFESTTAAGAGSGSGSDVVSNSTMTRRATRSTTGPRRSSRLKEIEKASAAAAAESAAAAAAAAATRMKAASATKRNRGKRRGSIITNSKNKQQQQQQQQPQKRGRKRSIINTTTTRTTTRGGATVTPKSKIVRTGFQTPVMTNVTARLGVVDPDSGIQGTIPNLDASPCDAMLCLVDPQANTDKYFILQLIQRTAASAASAAAATTKRRKTGGRKKKNTTADTASSSSTIYVVYSRWGRTGTTGQGMEQDFGRWNDAVKCFQKKFKDKTDIPWNNRDKPAVAGKYRFIQQDFTQKRAGYTSAKWQYWVDDGVDGKPDGWYDYDRSGSVRVERLFAESRNNTDLGTRLVASGSFTYRVDLANMTQTNVTHANHTSRRIRRYEEQQEET